jgi:hypothetical protein
MITFFTAKDVNKPIHLKGDGYDFARQLRTSEYSLPKPLRYGSALASTQGETQAVAGGRKERFFNSRA